MSSCNPPLHWLTWSLMAPALLLALASTAFASAKSTEKRVQEARVQCMTGQYQEGVRILAELYVQTLDANFVYNQGRCYEQNGKNDQAILRFEEYLRVKPKLSPDQVADVRARIDSLRSTPKPVGPPAAEPLPVEAAAGSPAAVEARPTPSAPAPYRIPALDLQSAPAQEPAPAEPVYKKWWLWTGIGAVVVGGVVAAILLRPKDGAKSPSCDLEALCAAP